MSSCEELLKEPLKYLVYFLIICLLGIRVKGIWTDLDEDESAISNCFHFPLDSNDLRLLVPPTTLEVSLNLNLNSLLRKMLSILKCFLCNLCNWADKCAWKHYRENRQCKIKLAFISDKEINFTFMSNYQSTLNYLWHPSKILSSSFCL